MTLLTVIIGMVLIISIFFLILRVCQLWEIVKGSFERGEYCGFGDFGDYIDCYNWDGFGLWVLFRNFRGVVTLSCVKFE